MESSENTGGLKIHIPADASYNCLGCGRCCGEWAIGMTEADYDKVKDIDWGQIEPRLAGKQLFVDNRKQHQEGLSAYPYFTKSGPDGRCPFLVDSLCVIHKTLGEENKPVNCRLFPYTFSPTPDGVFVGLAYSSTAAAKNAGRPLVEQASYLRQLWDAFVKHKDAQAPKSVAQAEPVAEQQGATEAASTSPVPADSQTDAAEATTFQYQLSLAPGVPLTWDEYKLVETRLTREFDAEQSALDAILNCLMILTVAGEWKREGKNLSELASLQPNAKPFAAPAPMAENLLFNLLSFRFFVLPSIRISRREQWTLTGQNALSDPAVLKAALGTVFGGKAIMPFGTTIDIAKTRKAKMDPLPAEAEVVIKRFMRLKLFGKNYFGPFFGGFSLSTGFNTLVAAVLSTLLYTKGAALNRGESVISMDDLYQGIVAADCEQLSFTQLPPGKAMWFDMGLSTPTTLGRLLHEFKKSLQTN